jgi:protein TonB
MFVPYDSAPEPIGGFTAIQKNLTYPEIARRAGVEGMVVVQVLIDTKGNVNDTKVAKSLGNNGCDEAAIAAIKKTKWKPALQRDKPVKVWVSIPVIFKLKEAR